MSKRELLLIEHLQCICQIQDVKFDFNGLCNNLKVYIKFYGLCNNNISLLMCWIFFLV